jgi:hypothetical protein
MKRRPREEEPYFLGLDESNARDVSYARDLRAIGQALEDKNLLSLDLELEGGIYVARGKVRPARFGGPSIVDLVRDLISSARGENVAPKIGKDLETRFTAEGIHAIDSEGRNRRRDPNQTPDAHSLSQILRGAGAYLDKQHNTSLVGITIHDRWVTLRYRTVEGRLEEAKQDLEFFYNYWVKMYLQRSNRHKMSQPALSITWK